MAAAENDTNIIVSNAEVDKTLNQRIDDFISQAGSQKKFEEMVGQPLRKIKAQYWIEIKNMMFMEKYKYSLVEKIKISRIEIENFYSNYKDSIPSVPEYYSFSIIDIQHDPSQNSKDKMRVLLDSLRNILLLGSISFDSLATKYSDDPGTKNNGGRIGFTKRGTLVIEYEEAAFSLNPGEISTPIKSDFGYHLIKLLEKKGEKISTQHILKTITISDSDKKNTLNKINKIKKTTLNDPFVFDSIAVNYQSIYNNLSGKYEKQSINMMPEIIYHNIKDMLPYQISSTIETEHGFFIIFLYEHKDEFFPTPENSWTLIKQYALQEKQNSMFNNIVNKLKKTTHIVKY